MRRASIPLHSKRQAALIDTLNPDKNQVGPHEGITTHLLLGTGVRCNTAGHTSEDWFEYINGELYLTVPSREPCRKVANEGNESCGECSEDGTFSPKTPAGSGRQIPIPNEYFNHQTNEYEYFGLKDRVESYFGLTDDDAPDHAQFGFSMIQANSRDGVSIGSINRRVRSVCAKAGITAERRASRLEAHLQPNKKGVKAVDRIRDFGTNNEGRSIPDVIAHDLRASYCTQLCRTKPNEENPDLFNIKRKTGHKNISTLERYVEFGKSEINTKVDKTLF